MPILETSQLSRSFGELLAVDSVSFAVDSGDQPGVPQVWVHLRGEPPQERTPVRVSELPLYPPCRSDRCAQHRIANVAPPARLDEHGCLVSTPRGHIPGYAGP
jgi:hypothetical protein